MYYNSYKSPAKLIQAALAFFALLGFGQAYAACEQTDLQGTWYLNGISGDTFFAEFIETNFCKFKISSTGKVFDSGSQCKFRDDAGVGVVNITSGDLTLGSTCRITGYITASEGGQSEKVRIDDARLDKRKTVITMVGRSDVDPDGVFFLTGVKR